jgi:4-amino-4-deoxy-L-arabinose transferase-like glycosyltransferase
VEPIDGPRAPSSAWGFAARRPAFVAALAAALLYLPWLSAAPVRGTLEANRLVAAREMLARGDWILPTLNGEPYLAKPPFQYWLIEVAARLTGFSIVPAGRLVSALAVIGLAALVAAYGKRTVSGAVGLVAGLGVAVAGIVVEKGVVAELETVLAAAVAAAAVSFHLAVVDPRRRLLLHVLLGGLALGAAFLTKGPVALLFLVPAAVAFAVASPKDRRRSIGVLLAQILLGAACAVPWILALAQKIGADRALQTFRGEMLERVRHAGTSNAEPWWFYGPGLLAALGPLLLLAPFLGALPAKDADRRPRILFLLAWAIAPVLLLSFSQGKETRYLISGIPAWALLLAEGLEAARASGACLLYRRILRALATWLSWLAPLAVVAGSFLARPSIRTAALAAGVLLLAARLLASIPKAGAIPTAAILALAGIKTLWAEVYFGEARARRPDLALLPRIAGRVPAGKEILVPEYDALLQLLVDRPMRIAPDLSRSASAPGAFAIVAAGVDLGAGWTEVERYDTGPRVLRLVRRDPASSP